MESFTPDFSQYLFNQHWFNKVVFITYIGILDVKLIIYKNEKFLNNHSNEVIPQKYKLLTRKFHTNIFGFCINVVTETFALFVDCMTNQCYKIKLYRAWLIWGWNQTGKQILNLFCRVVRTDKMKYINNATKISLQTVLFVVVVASVFLLENVFSRYWKVPSHENFSWSSVWSRHLTSNSIW